MPNRLASETSPYLLQHARNPVDWYPWGTEALARAREEDRPILLSVGYSACHWCHVMERESFEDPSVAAVMNRSFVNVKVDREERPDVDQVYMKAVQAMTGRGGWPLTVFLTPRGEPFYGGTYFPPEPRHGMPSFRQVLDAVVDAYTHRRADVERGAAEITDTLARAASAGATAATEAGAPGAPPGGESLLDGAMRALAARFDPAHGGFGGAPKFPQPATLEVLLRGHLRTADPEALGMALTTLRAMAAGGIRDHLAGGFHRYSVDERWLVPHFEKMLYDNALLAQSYLDAWRVTGAPDLREVAEESLDWLLAEMRGPEGGFFAALDADSEGEEGRCYLWDAAEVAELLGPEEGPLFQRAYDVTEPGNFEGRNILWLPHDLETLARSLGVDRADLTARLRRSRAVLRAARAGRVQPFRDEKVLVDWNALALRAFAEAGGALGRADYLAAARAGASFLLGALRPDGRLHHVWKDGVARVPAFLEDHAALGNALLSLHEATLEAAWLDEAVGCAREILSRFRDPDSGAFHDTADDAEALYLRPRDPMDNATPSGNSQAAELLARLGHLLDEPEWTEAARSAVAREAPLMMRFPTAFGRMLSVADRLAAPPVEVAVFGEVEDPATRALLTAALSPFHRNRTVTGRAPGAAGSSPPLLEGRGAVDGRATAWVCSGYACRAPTHDPGEVSEALSGTPGGPGTGPGYL